MQAVRHEGTLLAPGAGEIVSEAPAGLLDLTAKLLGAHAPAVGSLGGRAAAGGDKRCQSCDSKGQNG
jgi:hypothetical protein